MLRVPIPEGANLDVGEIRDGEIYKEFGVSSIMHGMVRNASGKPVEGSVLYFSNDHLRADVGRRDLTGEEINRIGKLCINMNRAIIQLDSLPGQIKVVEKLIKDMEISESLFRDRSMNSSFNATERVADLGILITQMKFSLVELREEWRKMISELASVGVTMIRDENGGLLRGGLPVGEMAIKFAADVQKN